MRFNPLALMVGFVLTAAVLTWVLPAGQFERRQDAATGRSVVVPGSYRPVDPNPDRAIPGCCCHPEGDGQRRLSDLPHLSRRRRVRHRGPHRRAAPRRGMAGGPAAEPRASGGAALVRRVRDCRRRREHVGGVRRADARAGAADAPRGLRCRDRRWHEPGRRRRRRRVQPDEPVRRRHRPEVRRAAADVGLGVPRRGAGARRRVLDLGHDAARRPHAHHPGGGCHNRSRRAWSPARAGPRRAGRDVPGAGVRPAAAGLGSGADVGRVLRDRRRDWPGLGSRH